MRKTSRKTCIRDLALLALCHIPSTALCQAAIPLPAPAAPAAPALPPAQPGSEDAPLHVKMIEEDEAYKPEFLGLPQMVKYGVTVGVAATFHTSAGWGDVDQSNIGVSAMPYVAIVPAYWGLGRVSREYCAARALTLSSRSALDVADAFAERQAQKAWDQAIKQNPELLAASLTDAKDTELAAAATAKKEFEGLDKLQQGRAIAYFSGWERGRRGKCSFGSWPWRVFTGTWLGLYFGVPFEYSANFKEQTEGMTQHVKRDIRSRGSVGIVLAPFPYLNVLAGFTSIVTDVPVDDSEDAPSRQKPAWQFSLGIGGTLDLVGAAIEAIK